MIVLLAVRSPYSSTRMLMLVSSAVILQGRSVAPTSPSKVRMFVSRTSRSPVMSIAAKVTLPVSLVSTVTSASGDVPPMAPLTPTSAPEVTDRLSLPPALSTVPPNVTAPPATNVAWCAPASLRVTAATPVQSRSFWTVIVEAPWKRTCDVFAV